MQQFRTAKLAPLDLALYPTETLALHGPSGAGKSLLLRAIADLDPNEGDIALDGKPRRHFSPADWRRQVMLVPAESHWWADTVRAHAADWSKEGLKHFGFEPDVLDWDVHRLSSGERQRLALLRALSHSPDVLLLDEPTANLDAHNTAQTETWLARYQSAQQASLIWVSHDQDQRERVAQRLAEIRDGKVTETTA